MLELGGTYESGRNVKWPYHGALWGPHKKNTKELNDMVVLSRIRWTIHVAWLGREGNSQYLQRGDDFHTLNLSARCLLLL